MVFSQWLIRLLGAVAFVGGSWTRLPAQAQQVPRAATHIDSLRATRDTGGTFYPATLTFVSGKQVKAWLGGYTTSFTDRVECYETSPDRIPRPELKAVSVERLTTLLVDGHQFESLRRKGKAIGLLAENVASPGPMELFGYAKTKNDMLVPIPLPVGGALFVSTGTHEKYFWYLRIRGGDIQEVPSGTSELVHFMSKLCTATPDLVDEMRRKPAPFKANNLPELVSRYNAAVTGR